MEDRRTRPGRFEDDHGCELDDPGGSDQACRLGRNGLAGCQLAGEQYGSPWDDVDFDADPDWEWRTGALDDPEDVYAVWHHAVERSRRLVDEVIESRGLDGPASFTWPDGRTPTVRDMLLDMIEEYARHTGHADVLREAVDGRVGEGAPGDLGSEGCKIQLAPALSVRAVTVPDTAYSVDPCAP